MQNWVQLGFQLMIHTILLLSSLTEVETVAVKQVTVREHKKGWVITDSSLFKFTNSR